MLTEHLTELGRQSAVDGVEQLCLVHLVQKARLLRHLRQDSWWQIKVNRVYQFVRHFTLRVGNHQLLGQPLTISLAAAVVLDLDVQVLRALRPKELATALIGTHVRAIDLLGSSPEVLLPFVLSLGCFGLFSLLYFPFCSDCLGDYFLLLLCFNLPLLGFLEELLLVLLLSQSVQELMRLGQDLGDKCILIKVFNVEDLSCQFVICTSYLVYVGDQILVLKEKFPVLLVIISTRIEHRRLVGTLDRL